MIKTSIAYINALLQQEDIEGYIGISAPSDEYSSEAAHIAAAIAQLGNHDLTNENITAILVVEWQESFNLTEADISSRQDALQRVAQAIIQDLQRRTQ